MDTSETIRAEAVDWAVRTNDPGFADWEGFTVWLEADPAHGEAYDTVCAAVAESVELLRNAGPANDGSGTAAAESDGARPGARPRRYWLGGAIAASLAVAAGLWTWQQERAQPYLVATAPGETRMVTLADGSAIALAGGTRLELDRNRPRNANLLQGQALFTVRHDPDAPFLVAVGEDELLDIGTVFDVTYSGGTMSVAVSEGAVQFNPDTQNVRIDPGQRLSQEPGTKRYVLSEVPVEQVGEWREGRLTFDRVPLESVAAQLTRATGVRFAVLPGGDSGVVSGSVLVEPIRSDPGALGPLLGLAVRPAADGWTLAPL